MTEDILEKANAILEDPDPTCGWTGTMIDLIAEVERLRSENKIISDRAAHHDRQDAKEIELLAARIAELEAGKLMYEEIAESYQIGVDDLRAYIKRLEAAFLESEAENQFHQDYGESEWAIHPEEDFEGHWGRNRFRTEASDALKRIKGEREG